MQLSPSFDQPSLPSGKRSGEKFHRLDVEDAHMFLVVGMEVGAVMWSARLRKHSYDNAEEPRNLRHETILSRVQERRCRWPWLATTRYNPSTKSPEARKEVGA